VTSPSILEKCCLLTEAAAVDPTHYMMEQALEQAELDWQFLSCEIDPDRLVDALTGLDVLGFRGVKLAEPFRVPAANNLAHLTARARLAGSVTCLVRQDGRLVGDELLGDAFVQALAPGVSLASAELVVVGAGGVARSLAAAAASAGATSISIADAPSSVLEELVAELAAELPQTQFAELSIDENRLRLSAGTRVVVYAPQSADAIRPTFDTTDLTQSYTLVDTRLSPSRTGLSRFAAGQGATVIDGVELLARETALTLQAWTGLDFHIAPLREMAEEYLGV
jgi:shikimate dehydrogenase